MPTSGSLHSLPRIPARPEIFAAVWLIATLLLGGLLILEKPAFNSSATPYALASLLLCTLTLAWWLRNPVPNIADSTPYSGLGYGADRTHTGRLILLILAVGAVLFPLRTLVGPALLFGLPILALLVLIGIRWRSHSLEITRHEAAYALALAIIAGIGGLGAGWIRDFSLLLWAVLQVLLTLSGLLAGWVILRHAGLMAHGVGCSRFLEDGPSPALKSVGLGILIGMPWALGLVLMGSAQGETWVKSWWQPLTAIQPGIAEEAWGRILLVPTLFLLFRLAAGPRVALNTALMMAAYWFAYLHTPGGVGSILNTLILGTLFSLPVSYLCLYRDLETAVGFHFWLDFCKFLWALLFL